TAQELPMFDAFIDIESDAARAEHSAAFIHLKTPFTADDYGQALIHTLAAGMLDGREALAELELASDWEPPARARDERDVPYLVRTCTSFRAHYALQGQLVLILRPDELPD